MAKKILFVSYGGGHVAALAPVYHEVVRLGYSPGYLALTTAPAFLEAREIPSFGFAECPGAKDPNVQNWGRVLLDYQIKNGDIDADRIGFDEEESICYLGLSFRDLVGDFGEDEAWKKFKLHGRPVFLPVMAMRDLLLVGEYDALITTNSPRAEKASILAASVMNIPSICVVDLFAVHDRDRLKCKSYADKLCVITEGVKRGLVDAGRPSDSIVVTGNPAFDALFDSGTADIARRASRQLSIEKGCKVILWASHREPAYHPATGKRADELLPSKILSILVSIVDQDPSLCLIVRPHPSESAPEIHHERVRVCGQEYALEPLLCLSDLVVTMVSTVGLQALLLEKPVVAVRMSVYEGGSPLARVNLKTAVDRLEDLEEMVQNLLKPASIHPPNDFVKDYGCDGSASSAVAKVLAELLVA